MCNRAYANKTVRVTVDENSGLPLGVWGNIQGGETPWWWLGKTLSCSCCEGMIIEMVKSGAPVSVKAQHVWLIARSPSALPLVVWLTSSLCNALSSSFNTGYTGLVNFYMGWTTPRPRILLMSSEVQWTGASTYHVQARTRCCSPLAVCLSLMGKFCSQILISNICLGPSELEGKILFG